MSATSRQSEARELAKAILASPRLSSALTTATIGTAVFTFVLHQLIGWPGLLAIISGLIVLTVLSLVAQWQEIGWSGLLPISLLVFVGWSGVSIFWSQYHWATLAGIVYLLAFTVLGIFVALARDTIQIVRAFGNVLRAVLGVSLALEIFSGLLIDTPIPYFGLTGRLGNLGPIQGILDTRDQFGLVAVIAIITFATELRTKSVTRGMAVGSLIVGGICLLLSRAPLAIGAAIVVGAAAAALYGLRRASDRSQRFWQLGVLVVTVTVAILAWVFRRPIVGTFNASGALNYRLTLWHDVWGLTQSKILQGWGWVGSWPMHTVPFTLVTGTGGRFSGSALNAYLDVWFQLGLIGFILFLGFLGLAFTRSWLLASRRRSVVFTWPALVLVVLLIGALAESWILTEFGWLTLVVCSVKASRELSWRTALGPTLRPELPVSP
jgi:O-antigen ligase